MSDSSTNSNPSLISSHAKYAQGALSSTLGYESGEATKREAVQEMKQAAEQRDQQPTTQSGILGSAEKKLGEITGCEGMEREGEERIPVENKGGVEAQNGTG